MKELNNYNTEINELKDNYNTEINKLKDNLRAEILNFFDSNPHVKELNIEDLTGGSIVVGEWDGINILKREGVFYDIDSENTVYDLKEISHDDLSFLIDMINTYIEENS